MDGLAHELVPIVAILATFGCPVAFLFVFKWFKLREKELQFDAETRREMNAAVEARVQRLESVLLQLEPHLQRRDLMQGPPDLRVTERADDPLPTLLRKDVRG
jgi:hypothetical protein